METKAKESILDAVKRRLLSKTEEKPGEGIGLDKEKTKAFVKSLKG